MTADPARFALVRELRGGAAQVLLAFLFANGAALDIDDVRLWTGLERHAIYDALKLLASKGLLVKQTTAHRRMVWLPSGQALVDLFQLEENPPTGTLQLEENPPTGTLQLEENPPTGLPVGGKPSNWKGDPLSPAVFPTVFTTTAIKTLNINPQAVVESQLEENPPTGADPAPSAEHIQANLAACAAHGIGEPNASKIARSPWVTPELIQQHVMDLLETESVGLAIIRILGHETPRSWQTHRRKSRAEQERELADHWVGFDPRTSIWAEYLDPGPTDGPGVAAETGAA
jgi:hypothetical protein